MSKELAECNDISKLLEKIGPHLDQYLRFEQPDAMVNAEGWQVALGGDVPAKGIGIDGVIADMGKHLIPNGSQIPNPGCTSWITTGATSMGVLATLAGSVASPQRIGLTAFNYLEEVSLNWMAEMFDLPVGMKGVYSSGGSVANLVALGGARQWAFEKLGLDPARDGMCKPCRIYTSEFSHHTIHRSAAVLGMGRASVVGIPVDENGRMSVKALKHQLAEDQDKDFVPVAIVATAGITSTGVIDPLREIGEVAQKNDIWFHVDGAYGLPGILDPKKKALYDGLELASSVIVDPHKWLGAPVGIGATFVKDYGILERGFTQGESDYLEGSCEDENIESSMDSLGTPYSDFAVELSAPPRGAVVWAMIKEIGKEGLRARVCRHNAMAEHVAKRVGDHPNLELAQKPTLSICCFRYYVEDDMDLDELNKRIHRRLVRNGKNIPSTAVIDGKFVIRPCFIGARTVMQHADNLVDEVIEIGDRLVAENKG